MATTERFTDKSGQRKENTEWHNIVLWARLAEIAQQYLKKGMLVYIEGRIQTRSWNDKDGNKRYTTEIRANSMQMLTPKGASQASGAPMPEPSPDQPNQGPRDSDIPPPPEVAAGDDDLPF
jgi:single-strand DNA-binding protein